MCLVSVCVCVVGRSLTVLEVQYCRSDISRAVWFANGRCAIRRKKKKKRYRLALNLVLQKKKKKKIILDLGRGCHYF